MSSNDEAIDWASFQMKGDDLEWDAMQRSIDEGADPLDIEGFDNPLTEAVGDLFDWSQISTAYDEVAEAKRQIDLILQGDLAALRKLFADPSSRGEIHGKPEVEISPDGLVTTHGPENPTGGGYLTAHWRFARLSCSGVLNVAGLQED